MNTRIERKIVFAGGKMWLKPSTDGRWKICILGAPWASAVTAISLAAAHLRELGEAIDTALGDKP